MDYWSTLLCATVLVVGLTILWPCLLSMLVIFQKFVALHPYLLQLQWRPKLRSLLSGTGSHTAWTLCCQSGQPYKQCCIKQVCLFCVLLAKVWTFLQTSRKNAKFKSNLLFCWHQILLLVRPLWVKFLTLWRLGGFGDFRKTNSSFRLLYQRPSSSANCARELFNGSNGSASLVDCTRKKNFCLGGADFLWVTS